MNDPLINMVSAFRNGVDPRQFLQQMAPQFPMAAQASKMLSGKSNAELRQMAINMCQERGTSPEAVLKSLGLR